MWSMLLPPFRLIQQKGIEKARSATEENFRNKLGFDGLSAIFNIQILTVNKHEKAELHCLLLYNFYITALWYIY